MARHSGGEGAQRRRDFGFGDKGIGRSHRRRRREGIGLRFGAGTESRPSAETSGRCRTSVWRSNESKPPGGGVVDSRFRSWVIAARKPTAEPSARLLDFGRTVIGDEEATVERNIHRSSNIGLPMRPVGGNLETTRGERIATVEALPFEECGRHARRETRTVSGRACFVTNGSFDPDNSPRKGR